MRRAASLFVVIAIGSACRKSQTPEKSLVRRELPGFSIGLPKGVDKQAQLDYAAGKLRVEELGGGDAMLVLNWQFGKLVDEAAALEIARAAARSDGLDPNGAKMLEYKADGVAVFTIDGAQRKLQSLVQCGARVVSFASYEVGEKDHRRITESLRCEPDPAQETAATSIPIAIDLPGFAAYQRTPGTIALSSATATVILRRQSGTGLSIEQLEREHAMLFKALQLDAQVQPRRGNVLPFVATVEGSRELGVLRPIVCGTSSVLVIATAGDEASAADIEKRVEAARCLGVGEAPPEWPDLPPEP